MYRPSASGRRFRLTVEDAYWRGLVQAYDPGLVVCDLVVAIADGGDCLADLGVPREQPQLFGEVASSPTDLLRGRALGPAARGREAGQVDHARVATGGAGGPRLTSRSVETAH